jgi:hypothetical protein
MSENCNYIRLTVFKFNLYKIYHYYNTHTI